ncbi:MAG: zinc ribbon domain-containing protein [Candidatus Binatia bacterium]
MPIYEYECQKCGTFEATQKITEKPLGKCPTCKGKVKKLISNTSFQLKGTGWYVTDYARKDKGAEKGGNGAKSSTESKEAKDTKSEAKTETKTESSPSKSEKSSTAPSSTSA